MNVVLVMVVVVVNVVVASQLAWHLLGTMSHWHSVGQQMRARPMPPTLYALYAP